MNQTKRDRIAARAYEIWEREGRPPDKNEEHWRLAEQELAREDGGEQMGASAERSPAPELDTGPAPPVKAASPLGANEETPAEGAKRPKRKTASPRPRSRKPPQQG